jgi:hypothetical protein
MDRLAKEKGIFCFQIKARLCFIGSNLFLSIVDHNGGDFFHSFSKVRQLSSNLTNVVDNDRF